MLPVRRLILRRHRLVVCRRCVGRTQFITRRRLASLSVLPTIGSSVTPTILSALDGDIDLRTIELKERCAIAFRTVSILECDVLSVEELVGVCCRTSGMSQADAHAFISRLDDSGVLFVLAGGDMVHLQPLRALCAAAIKTGILDVDPLVAELRAQIDGIERLLEPLEQRKAAFDDSADRSTQRVLAAIVAALASLLFLMVRLTFLDFDWDVMEPISDLVMTCGVFVACAYFGVYRMDFNLPDLRQRLLSTRRLREYARGGFEIEIYSRQRIRRDALTVALRAHAAGRPRASVHRTSRRATKR